MVTTKSKKRECTRDNKKYSLLNRKEKFNNLEKKMVQTINIHEFKVKMDAYRYGDGTARTYNSFPVKHN